MKTLLAVILNLCFLPSLVFANPVSFKGGWGIMPAFTPDWHDLDINYSLSNRLAVGASSFYREGKDSNSDFGIARVNYLVKRWNELESQGNLYVSAGLGGRHDSQDSDALASFASLGADWETRRIYSLVGYETLQSEADVEYNKVRGRLGIAPYLANFEELHTWLVLQVDHMPEMHEETEVTPLARFFYDNIAVELGVSLRGNVFVAALAHF